MRTTHALMVIMLMWVVLGTGYYGYLSSNAVAIIEAVLIGVIWFGELIGRMLEEG